MSVNEQVRQAVRQRMKAEGITQDKLADLVGMQQPNVARLLSGRSGSIPETWQRVLDALGLELIAVQKKAKQ